jgi:hypothetical protein
MIDPKTLEIELRQARAARLDAEAAGSEVEALIWSVQRFQPGKQRLLFILDGGQPEPGEPAHEPGAGSVPLKSSSDGAPCSAPARRL